MKLVTVEEFQVTFLVRPDLGHAEVRDLRKALAGNQFVRVLRGAVQRVIRKNAALNNVIIRVSR